MSSFSADSAVEFVEEKPWFIAVAAAVALVIMCAVTFVMRWIWRRHMIAALGPFPDATRAVYAAHALSLRGDAAGAARLYRGAISKVYGSAAPRAEWASPVVVPVDGEGVDEAGAGAEASALASAVAAAKHLDEVLRAYNAAAMPGMNLAFGLRLKAFAAGGGGPSTPPETSPRRSLRDAAVPCAVLPEQEAEDALIRVCNACCGRSKVPEEASGAFRCFSCNATMVPWDTLVAAPAAEGEGAAASASAAAPRDKARHPVLLPLEGLLDLAWEDASLETLSKHPSGCGRLAELPPGCKHHGQVGATCGMAAVNNLITNLGLEAIDGARMLAISARLGAAEANLRGGEDRVQEAGEERAVAELYAATDGGHFDVQTLQIAFEEAGLRMAYMQPGRAKHAAALLEAPQAAAWPCLARLSRLGDGGDRVVGYVVHWRDELNNARDHWFIVRPHGDGKNRAILLQDSLYERIFALTSAEANRLLTTLPPGALFAVSATASVVSDPTGNSGVGEPP